MSNPNAEKRNHAGKEEKFCCCIILKSNTNFVKFRALSETDHAQAPFSQPYAG